LQFRFGEIALAARLNTKIDQNHGCCGPVVLLTRKRQGLLKEGNGFLSFPAVHMDDRPPVQDRHKRFGVAVGFGFCLQGDQLGFGLLKIAHHAGTKRIFITQPDILRRLFCSNAEQVSRLFCLAFNLKRASAGIGFGDERIALDL